jgi:flagellar hook-associated protein 2
MATTSITTALGAGSGVNISELVSSLVDAQYANKTARLTQKTETITKQISGVASVKSGITGFASALSALVKGGSLGTAPTSSNPSVVTATALSGAKLAGMSSTIEVRQLAQSQVATSAIKKDGIASMGLGSFTLTTHEIGSTDLAFNGATEWALDAVTLADAVWLPREDQLRELLRGTFRSLTRLSDAFVVEVEIAGSTLRFEHPDPSEAYGRALLDLVSRSR